jgi:hypothetical protein
VLLISTIEVRGTKRLNLVDPKGTKFLNAMLVMLTAIIIIIIIIIIYTLYKTIEKSKY